MYQATATILIERPAILEQERIDNSGLEKEELSFLQTQHEILRSRGLAEAVVSRLKLSDMTEFDPDQQGMMAWQAILPSDLLDSVLKNSIKAAEPKEKDSSGEASNSPGDEQQTVRLFMDRLVIAPVRNTQLVEIRFQAFDPEVAALFANTIAEQYISTYMTADTPQVAIDPALKSENLEAVHQRSLESEARLNSLQQLIDPPTLNSVETGEGDAASAKDDLITQLTVRNMTLRRARIEAEKHYDKVVIFGSPPPVEYLLQLPVIIEKPIVQSLVKRQEKTQAAVDELAGRYGPKHPKMIAAQEELEVFKGELETQLFKAAEEVEAVYQAALEKEKASSRQLDLAKQRLQEMSQVTSRQSELGVQLVTELEQEVESNRQLYEGFLARFEELPAPAAGPGMQNARVINAAIAPVVPFMPDSRLVYLSLILAALIVGAIRAWTRSAKDNTIDEIGQIDELLQVPVLGSLPAVEDHLRAQEEPGKVCRVYEGVIAAADSPFTESVIGLRTSMILSRVDQACKVIMVTSTQEGEGKSTLALNLAEAFGKSEDVLLVDADFRRSMLAGSLGISSTAPGLSDLIANTAEIEQCLHSLEGTRASVMTAGTPPGNPEEVLSSRKFQMVLAVLKKLHDRIIIDTGPVLAVNDAMALAAFADSIIYVVKAGETLVPQIHEGIRRLREADAGVAGVVLNQVSPASFKNQYAQRKYPTYSEPVKSDVKITGVTQEEPLITIQRKEPSGLV